MSPDAVYFCTIGAIHRVSGGSDAGFAARSELSRYLGMHLTDWNDGHVKNGEQAAKTLEKAAEAIA